MSDRLPSVQHRSKQPHDTASGCAERAAADLAAAAATNIDNVRRRFEISAESWMARAAMLQRVADSADARTATEHAEWNEEDVPLRAALRGRDGEADHVRL
jgi:hypothetical protein